jgi:hypothetical protein
MLDSTLVECIVTAVTDAAGRPVVSAGPTDDTRRLDSSCLAAGPGESQRTVGGRLVHSVDFGDPIVVAAADAARIVEDVARNAMVYGVKRRGSTRASWLVVGVDGE